MRRSFFFALFFERVLKPGVCCERRYGTCDGLTHAKSARYGAKTRLRAFCESEPVSVSISPFSLRHLVWIPVLTSTLLSHSIDAKDRDPVLLVAPLIDVFRLLPFNETGTFDKLKTYLVQKGWDPERFEFVDLGNPLSGEWMLSNETRAELVRAAADRLMHRTQANKIDIVAFSSGALSSRWYIRYLGGASKVSEFVSIAGSNHGSVRVNVLTYTTHIAPSIRELYPRSDFLSKLNASERGQPGEAYGARVLLRYPDGKMVERPGINYYTIAVEYDGLATLTKTVWGAHSTVFDPEAWKTQLISGATNIVVRDRILHRKTPQHPGVLTLLPDMLEDNLDRMASRLMVPRDLQDRRPLIRGRDYDVNLNTWTLDF